MQTVAGFPMKEGSFPAGYQERFHEGGGTAAGP